MTHLITPTALRHHVDLLQFDELKASAQYALELDDEQYFSWPLLALACAHLGEREAAESACLEAEKYLKAGKLDTDAQVDLAGVYCLFLRVDDAISLLEAALLAEAEHGLALARLAWCKLFINEREQARSLYEKSASLNPERLPIWSGLSRVCLELKDDQAAQDSLDKGIAQFRAIFHELSEQTAQQFTEQFRVLQLEIWVNSHNLANAEEWLEQRKASLEEKDWSKLAIHYSKLLAGQGLHDAAEEMLKRGLKHYPQNIEMMTSFAELAHLLGRIPQTVKLYKRVIACANKQDLPTAHYWLQLSSTLLHTNSEWARKATEKATRLIEYMQESDDLSIHQIKLLELQAKNALAQVESQEQHFDKARALFESILAEHAYYLPALQGLGNMEMQQGNIEQAISLFERVKKIDPVKGHSSLISARQFPDDEVTLTRLEKLARQSSMEGVVRSGLLLQLASAWEKRKVYDKAFELAFDANESSKNLLKYDPVEHRNKCARVRYAFSKSLYEHRPNYNVTSSLPVFVLGMPRSGTTLVEQILAGHSDIFGAGELGVIPSRIQGLNRWERHVGSGRQYPDCVDDLSLQVREGIANGILDELKELAEDDKPNARHVVDKLPHNFENVGFIKFFFPNAKIISVRRDPRDIALSNYFTDYQAKHGGMGFAYDMMHIGEQLADHNMMMHHWHNVFPGEILEINYEDVVSDTEGSAKKMLDYIGVDWEPEVLNFNELDRTVKTASVWQVRQPIYKTAMAKWKRYEAYLAPLIKGTNAKIKTTPITDMISLPEAGLLQAGVAFYKEKQLDKAEYELKKLLHHIPEHAAANAVLSLIYVQKGHLADATPLLERSVSVCPWNQNWSQDLAQLYRLQGDLDKAKTVKLGKEMLEVESEITELHDGFEQLTSLTNEL
ncbi:tetratricopeptide repeat-containing sulfotransferase family protein [Psychromonas algicola]|uniref:tetratricopeptide repeat-containing sulfotransferase family protein n=1 Tax=Psychromonas algicola TaxID=2555642 RepID=UPI001068532E|nr:tetratricopeptide repeat-containing sulfotransferase family protein [Psychromonas sp. RZ5]TEW51726.1 tetratricopeptide repeat protein [Psychromonas sp. RZ5]